LTAEQVTETKAEKSAEREVTIRRVFRISLIIKAIDSAIEMAAGAALYLVSYAAIIGFVQWLTHRELMEDPRDFLANMLLHAAETFSVPKKTFVALYLVAHGAIKLVLVIMVLRDKPWAYPAFMAALALLITYQSYRVALGFSLWLAVLTVFDAMVLILTWHEWKLHRRVKAPGG